MNNTDVFQGFPKEGVQFLIDLRSNNNRPWFQEHKQQFKDYLQTPAQQFGLEMSKKLSSISPSEKSSPRVNSSIFRIYRDIRFSKDKTPYKSHIGIWMWEGDRPKMENSGYYFHLDPPNLMLGVGIHQFSKTLLKAYRDSVVNPVYGPDLVDAIHAVTQKGKYSIGGKHYKRIPRGYDAKNEFADLLLYNGLWVGDENVIPPELYSSQLLDYCLEIYSDLVPIHSWLLKMTERIESN